jgi:three-Cys-motif partner protein
MPGIKKLETLRDAHANNNRRITVLHGDFNKAINSILSDGRITEKKATFALLDQRTFECEWSTVKLISEHKTTTKIEQFYFFATGWVDRSLAAVRAESTKEKVGRWWGRDDWRDLLGMDSTRRAAVVAERFKTELGYSWVKPYPIHSKRRGGRVMYHMIHATDHPEATPLMVRAYRKVSGRSDVEVAEIQANFDELWSRIENDEE